MDVYSVIYIFLVIYCCCEFKTKYKIGGLEMNTIPFPTNPEEPPPAAPQVPSLPEGEKDQENDLLIIFRAASEEEKEAA